MKEYASYYEEKLYPLQDGVLRILGQAFARRFENVPFLTGGTALSRCFFGHRYSDDLDFFSLDDSAYSSVVEHAVETLDGAGYEIEHGSLLRTEAFSRFTVVSNKVRLRIDFVNDIAQHFGDFESWDQYPRIDSLQNMLSNKITAVYRLEPKDIVDLREIALHYPFHWADAMREADIKEAGIDAVLVSELISTFPMELFETVKWRRFPGTKRFKIDIEIMARDLIEVGPNTLGCSHLTL